MTAGDLEADLTRCPTCGASNQQGARFCGRCGARLDDVRTAVDLPVERGTADASPDPTVRDRDARSPLIGRRGVLLTLAGLVVGGLLGGSLARARAPQQTLDDDGLPTAQLEVGDARGLAERIAANGLVVVPDDAGRVAVVGWDPSHVSENGAAMERYGPDGEGHPVLDASTGLLVVSLISTHLGCRVSFCSTSTWFEDPCHGSRWNAWGEWVGGPAPRGLDRIGSHVRDDGILVVDLTRHITGPPRDNGILEENAAGPSCVDQ